MRFAGYAAVFDRPDTGGDIVRRGAFVRSLGTRTPVRLLSQHDTEREIGRIERLEEDPHGLRVIAKLKPGLTVAPGAGLSFGYHTRRAHRPRGGTYRELMDLDLIEVSVVTHPMQPLARVLRVAEQPVPAQEQASNQGDINDL